MKNLAVARRYAKALYELAQIEKSVDDVVQGMSNLTVAFGEAPELEQALLNPTISADDKERIVRVVTSNPLILKLIELLIRRARLEILPAIFSQLVDLSDASQGIHRALVKTVVTLSDAQKRAIETDLAKSVGGRIIGKFEVAAELIGGVWIKMGDHVLDASLQRRIEDFRQALVHSAN